MFQEILNTGRWQALIVARMQPGSVLGNHYHEKTDLFLYLNTGSARITTVDVETGERDRFSLQANQGVILRAGEAHAIRFVEASEAVILKSRAYSPDDPDTYEFPVPEE